VADALEFAYKGMTRELDGIAQTVSQAFGSQNPQLAEQQLARSTRIKDLQEKTKWLLHQWLSVKPEG